MRSVDQWLEEYGDSHRHPINKALHWVCVPLIVLTVLGLLSLVPLPRLSAQWPWLNAGSLAATLAVLYYLRLSPQLALGVIPLLLLAFIGIDALGALPWPLWGSCVAIFVIAWIGQFIGHAVEGRRPSFFKDLQFLLIGPLWLLAFVYRAAGIRYSGNAAAIR